MLLGDGERPARSGMKQAATEATNDLILDLRRAVAELWGARADAIKAACAPHVPTGRVDEMDALAWLTADALGHPLMHADDTNPVGKPANPVRAHFAGRFIGGEKRSFAASGAGQGGRKICALMTGEVAEPFRWLCSTGCMLKFFHVSTCHASVKCCGGPPYAAAH